MTAPARMSRADSRRWRAARTPADLGDLMAHWLEGGLGSRPGYEPHWGPDDETTELIPTLAALCRTGYITTCSQPGLASTGANGGWWEQKAAVTGLVTDEALLASLLRIAADTGMNTCVNHLRRRGGRHGQPIVVTTCDGQPVTAFGGRIRRADFALEWAGLHPRLFAQIATGTYLTIAAPAYGTTGRILWQAVNEGTSAT
ncbi:hypothetical protein OH723_31990 (plasmid) [Streptomyces albidoflavus]|uniref:DUF6919 domain-containing protein n=1 Tax=Streptomyces albidoflavus TaxID=1886 RepID=UPI00386F0F34|nr:hypothetical protein OH723_31990 [Streptomyces albidoflavus]